MDTIQLTASSSDERIDKILRGVVGIMETVFPARIRGYYLVGSYSDGSTAPNSDVDLCILFKDDFCDRDEFFQAWRICNYCAEISPWLLEVRVLSEERLGWAEGVGFALELQHNSLPIYGVDTRSSILNPTMEQYVRWAMHTPYGGIAYARGIEFTRPSPVVLTFPLDYPDPNGTFYGYDQDKLPTADGSKQDSTKLLVGIVGRIATALVALSTSQYVRNKSASVAMYRTHINDQWTSLVQQVYQKCRNEWGYLVPTEPNNRQHLKELCQLALKFENYFLLVYKEFLLKELQDSDRTNQLLAIRRFGQILYPDPSLVAKLKVLAQSDDADVQSAAEATLQKLASSHA